MGEGRGEGVAHLAAQPLAGGQTALTLALPQREGGGGGPFPRRPRASPGHRVGVPPCWALEPEQLGTSDPCAGSAVGVDLVATRGEHNLLPGDKAPASFPVAGDGPPAYSRG